MSLFSTLIVACTLSSLVFGDDYGMGKSNDWPTTRDIGHINTPSPTKWAPPSYDGKSNWKKNPSYPTYKKTQKPTYAKTKKPTYAKTKKPTKYSPPKGWKKNAKPTWQKNDHESYEKEAVSHIYNPYDIRQRGIVKAQLKERIESDKQELAALNELETVSDEQQDLDGEGVIEAASTDETVQKEAVSHIFNPYDIRKRRSAMRAAIEKSIDDEIAGLAELDELERQEEDGVKQVASGLPNGERCNSRFQCASICCSRFGAEFGRCRARVAVGLFFTNCEGQ
jgi:hypothetical protein